MNSKKRAVERILRTNLPDNIKNLIVKKIRVLRNNKGCWVIGEDWSHYPSYSLHRKVFEAFGGKIIGSNCVCHHCDRKGCFNPDHLFQGTHSDNMKDARRKGRGTYGYKKEYIDAHWPRLGFRIRT